MERDIIRRPKLYQEVATRLESLIVSGRFGVGERLPSERELTQRFGVGRPAVREALMTLEKMGLVAIQTGERARVIRPTPEVMVEQLSGAARTLLMAPDGIRHFQQARLLFETGLARQAAEHATLADLATLESALEANRRALGDMREFERTDVEFHYTIAAIPRNPIFTALHHAIVEWLTEQRTVTLRRRGAAAKAFEHHRRIYLAIAARDPDAADAAMHRHMLEVADLYWKVTMREKGRTS